ncbi:hypothetical protein BV898_08101 [Hypsibius exemplaris]|uniref:Gustatory receptor n=1 Tax=Hypsibius exemplaris TaxID=2072580 RepID=A0A1W0WRH0_HYPEX|nr:hypothetical protein BV898_08101 [Hypsibius exemplaris]
MGSVSDNQQQENGQKFPYQRYSESEQDFNADNGYVVASHGHECSDRHDSSNSAVRVEICDLDERTYTTTGVLRRCQQVVLQPYSKLLILIGWRSIGKDSINSGSFALRLCNVLFTTFVISMQIYTYVYQIIACEGKLSIDQDTHDPTTTPGPGNTTFNPWIPIGPSAKRRQCYHITTTYIVPAVLHSVIYVMGFIHFRLQDNEYLYGLMEKVFLQHAPFHRALVHSSVIYSARLYLYLGIAWAFLAVSVQGLSAAAFGITPSIWFLDVQEEWWTKMLFAFQLLGFLLCYLVWAAVIVNYATQCELLVAFINGICLRLREKSTDLRLAMHDILGVRENLSTLNGTLARMTAIGVLSFGELSIMGLCLLVLNVATNPWTWVYRIIFPLTFGLALLFPLIQAARVSKTGEKLKQICFEMRVFGYKDSNHMELDSFLLFVNHATLRPKLFSVPIKPALIMSLVAGTALTLLVLFQMGVIAGANILF